MPNVLIPGSEDGHDVRVQFDITKFNTLISQLGIPTENYSPVVQIKLDSTLQKNIEITGEFRTNYDPLLTNGHGGYSYITVRKSSSGKADAVSGYGIAWRPSSYNIDNLTLEGNYGGTTITLSDAGAGDLYIGDHNVAFIKTTILGQVHYLPFEFSRTSGSDNLTDCIFPAGATPDDGSVTIILCEPNLFIVDNDMVNTDLVGGKFFDFPGNSVAYLESEVVNIAPNTQYYFKMTIGNDNTLDFYLETSEAALATATAKISCGARTTKAEYFNLNNMDAFGISIVNSEGSQWYYDNIRIAKVGEEYAVNYFEMDVSSISDIMQVYLSAYASGVGGNGLSLYAWNIGDETWDEIANNTYSSLALTISKNIDKDDYVEDNTLKLMVTSTYPSDSTTASKISLDYIAVKSAYNSGAHIGGCVDIYIDDNYIKSDTKDVVPDSSDFINVIDFGRAVVWIDKIIIKGSSPEVELLEGSDYIWIKNNPNYMNSSKGQSIIKFSPTILSECTIHYSYSPLVKNLQEWSENPNVSFKGQDILFRHKNIHLLAVSASAGDGTSESTISDYISDYIDTLTAVDDEYNLTYEGVREYLYGQGVRQLTAISITDTYRNDGIRYNAIINSTGDIITINKNTETFKMEGDI